MFHSEMQKHAFSLRSAGLPSDLVSSLSTGEAASSTSAIAALPPAQRMLVHEAMTDSLGKIWILFTCVSALGLLASPELGSRSSRDGMLSTRQVSDPKTRMRLRNNRRKGGKFYREKYSLS